MDLRKESLCLTKTKRKLDSQDISEKIKFTKDKLIELQVGQDTAYWELQQKYQQLEASHESLQQNMVDLQMQYENTKGQYHNELKNHEEVLKRIEAIHAITDTLVNNFSIVESTLSSGQNDMKDLCGEYNSLCVFVQELNRQVGEKKMIVENHQEKVKLQANQIDQLQQWLKQLKQQAVFEINLFQTQNEAAYNRYEKLTKDYNELNAKRTMELEQNVTKCENMQLYAKYWEEKCTELEAIVHEQRLKISTAETEIKLLKQQTSSDKVIAVMHHLKKQIDHKNSPIDNYMKENTEMHIKLKEFEANHDAYQTCNENCVDYLKRKAQLEAITLFKTVVETLEQNIEENIKKKEADKATIAQLSQEKDTEFKKQTSIIMKLRGDKLIPRASSSPVLGGAGLQEIKEPDFEEPRVYHLFSDSSESFMTLIPIASPSPVLRGAGPQEIKKPDFEEPRVPHLFSDSSESFMTQIPRASPSPVLGGAGLQEIKKPNFEEPRVPHLFSDSSESFMTLEDVKFGRLSNIEQQQTKHRRTYPPAANKRRRSMVSDH